MKAEKTFLFLTDPSDELKLTPDFKWYDPILANYGANTGNLCGFYKVDAL